MRDPRILTKFEEGVRVLNGFDLRRIVHTACGTIRILEFFLEAFCYFLEEKECQLLRVDSLGYGQVDDSILDLIAMTMM